MLYKHNYVSYVFMFILNLTQKVFKRCSRNSLLQTEESNEDSIASVYKVSTLHFTKYKRKFMKQNVNKTRKPRIDLTDSN